MPTLEVALHGKVVEVLNLGAANSLKSSSRNPPRRLCPSTETPNTNETK